MKKLLFFEKKVLLKQRKFIFIPKFYKGTESNKVPNGVPYESSKIKLLHLISLKLS